MDEWAWRKGQSYGTMLVDLERHIPVDLLQDASANSFAAWFKEHPSVELISRDRGTRLGPMGQTVEPHRRFRLPIEGRVIHNLGEALEKVLARHHTDLKRALTPEKENQVTAAVD